MQLLEDHFASLFDMKDPLQVWRKKSWDRLAELGLPRAKQEAFQYLPLKDLSFPKPASSPASAPSPKPHSLLFVDGYFQGAHLPQPLVCLKLDQAMLVYGVFLQNRMNRSLKEETDPFAAMNGAFQGQGAFLYIPPNTRVEEPIVIEHRVDSEAMISPRLQIFLGQGASLKIVQRISEGTFHNIYLDVNLDAGASLFFGDSLPNSPTTTLFSSYRFTLKKESRLHFLNSSKGSKLARQSLKVQLIEDHSEATLQGLTRLDQDLQSHIHSVVEHIAPHTRSRQHFKTIVRDRSRSSFEGKIVVRPEAQKTEAYQLNNHLLLSDEALSFAKPNLEVFADDVKASHGATVSQLNEEDLFYFRSRGFPLSMAQEMLAEGFCNEILEAVPNGIEL